jgi:SAM-dependent methyltransferase
MNTWAPDAYLHHAGFVPALGTGVVDLLDPKPGERILDLGCGEGTLTETIRARGTLVVGVDSSPAQIAAARTRGLDARVADGESLGFDKEFDAVFSNAAMHWMRRPDAVIDGVRRALRPGGRFVAEFGGHGCVGAIQVAIRAVLDRRGVSAESPWYFPTDDEYAMKLEAHGFAIDAMALFPRPTPLPTGIEGWLDTFAGPFLSGLPSDARQQAVGDVAALLRPVLCDRSGAWTADYVRLRFKAHLI